MNALTSQREPPTASGATVDGPMAAMEAALTADDPTAVVSVLDGQFYHGRPGSPVALRQHMGQRLTEALAGESMRESRWIEVLAMSPSPSGRQVACLLLANRYARDRQGALELAEALADYAHWEVREEAAGLLGTLLDRDFSRMGAWLGSLRSSRSNNLRRAVVLAPAAKGMLERLAKGPEPVVRMAVAKAIRRCCQRYPDEVGETLREWARDPDRAATAQLVGPARRRESVK